jgi:hypothetical protein
MSEFRKQMRMTFTAGADLQLYQYRIMRYAGSQTCNVASHDGANASVGAIGVLQNKPNTNEFATVAYFGESKVVAGGALTEGTFITTQGSGKAAAATSGDLVIGRVLETAGAEDEVVRCLLSPAYRDTSTQNS